MGAAAAFKTTGVSELGLLSKEEEAYEAELQAKQAQAVQHVRNNIFACMPVDVLAMDTPVFGRKRAFITLDRTAVAAMNEDNGARSPTRRRASHAADLATYYPESVVVDEEGNIHVNNGDKLPARVIPFRLLGGERKAPPAMAPPVLRQATTTALQIEWRDNADFLVEQFEVQHRPHRPGSSVPTAWRLLCTKGRRDPDLLTHQIDHLKPMTAFTFRCRQRNTIGWSEWSEPSVPLNTLADVPATPDAPFGSYISTDLVQLHWQAPRCHGAPIERFVLRGKAANDERFQVLYEGALVSFVVTSMGMSGYSATGAAEELHEASPEALQPGTVYVFDVQASNAVGWSKRSGLLSVTTPSARSTLIKLDVPEQVLRSRSSWLECWDARTEHVFYFNRITGVRSDDPPEPFVERETAEHGSDGEEGQEAAARPAVDPAVVFRKKRYRLLRSLYKTTGSVSEALNRGRCGSVLSEQANLLHVEVARDTVFEDTAQQFRLLTGQDLCRKSKVVFQGEEGIDSGGLTKEWFTCLSKAMCEPGRHLFRRVPADSGELEIDPDSTSDEASLELFKFVGKVIGKAVYDRHSVALPMTAAFYKILGGVQFGVEELEKVDPAMHRSLRWMLDNPIEGILFETFSVTRTKQAPDGASREETEDLCPYGRDREVTDENKEEYVELMARWRLRYGVHAQMESLLEGLAALVPPKLLIDFSTRELELLINGKRGIDVDEIRSCAIYQGGYNAEHRNVLWLWHMLRGFEPDLCGAFLRFVTGSNRIPLDGFDPPFNVTEGQDMEPTALPRAHTCFNQLVLPRYRTLDIMTEKVKFAVANAEGFQMA